MLFNAGFNIWASSQMYTVSRYDSNNEVIYILLIHCHMYLIL